MQGFGFDNNKTDERCRKRRKCKKLGENNAASF
jgi:hypothetical protein